MIPLAIITAAGLPTPEPDDLEAIIAKCEQDWAELDAAGSGSWFDHPDCRVPVEDQE